MSGLLYKDFSIIKKQGRVYLILIAFYAIFGVATKNVSMFPAMISVFALMLPLTTLSYDEASKWDKFALTMPVSRRSIVLSKYLLAFVISCVTLVLNVIVGALCGQNVLEAFVVGASSGFGILMLASAVLPLVFKLGVEKGRLALVAVVMIPAILFIAFRKLNLTLPQPDNIAVLLGGAVVIGILWIIMSGIISIGIYQKKEL